MDRPLLKDYLFLVNHEPMIDYKGYLAAFDRFADYLIDCLNDAYDRIAELQQILSDLERDRPDSDPKELGVSS